LRRRVRVEPVLDYAALTAGPAERRYALARVHSAQVSIRALRSDSYQLLALADLMGREGGDAGPAQSERLEDTGVGHHGRRQL